MAVIFNTGEVLFCHEVDVFNDYVMADMTFIPLAEVYEVMEMEE